MRWVVLSVFALAACGQTSAPDAAETPAAEVLSCDLASQVGDPFGEPTIVTVPAHAVSRDGRTVWWDASGEPLVVRHYSLNRIDLEQPAGFFRISEPANGVDVPAIPDGMSSNAAALNTYFDAQLDGEMTTFAEGSCAPAAP